MRYSMLLQSRILSKKSKGEAAEEGICLCGAQSGPLVKAMTAKC